MHEAPLARLLGATQVAPLTILGVGQVSQVPVDPHVRQPKLPMQQVPRHTPLKHSEFALHTVPGADLHPVLKSPYPGLHMVHSPYVLQVLQLAP